MLKKYPNSLKNGFSGTKNPVSQAEKRVSGVNFGVFSQIFSIKTPVSHVKIA
jgi:hypothetical protein